MTTEKITAKAIEITKSAKASRQAKWDAASHSDRRRMVSPDSDAEMTATETIEELMAIAGLGGSRRQRQAIFNPIYSAVKQTVGFRS